MSSTLSSVRSSPIPDLAYDSYRTMRRHPPPPPPLASTSSINHQDYSGEILPSNIQPPSSTLRSRKLPQASDPSDPAVVRRPSSFLLTPGGKAFNLESYDGEATAFWILLTILIILVVGNSVLTFLIFGVVRVGKGVESIEFLPNLLKFTGDTDLDIIYKRDGVLQGFANSPLEILGDDDGGAVNLKVHEGSSPSLALSRNGINVTNVEEFRVVDKKGRAVFSTNTPTLGLPRGVQKLDVRVAKVNRITSAVNASLRLESFTFTYLKGSEGTHLQGKEVRFKADQDILLKSVSGSIILSGRDGIWISVHDLPLVRESGVTRKSYTYTTHGKKESQFQLCVCMPEGKLYRVEIPLNNLARPEKSRVGCHTPKNPPC